MARKNIKTVDIENIIYEKLTKNAYNANTSIHKFINELIDQILTKNEFIKKVAPRFSVLEFSKESIIIKDEKLKHVRTIIISIQNGRLWCDLDEKNNCEHIHYALMLPQIISIKDKLERI